MKKQMKKDRTKNNWWIIVVAFIVGLLIGTFILGNLFGAGVSLGPNIVPCINGMYCSGDAGCCPFETCSGEEVQNDGTIKMYCKSTTSTKPVSKFRQFVGKLKNMR